MDNSHKVLEYTKYLNILYIEDNLELLNETYELFRDYFNIVDIAIDGKDGLDKYKEYYNKSLKYYDIVITDINMPKMNGISLTKEIYKENKNQSIIVISAHDEKKYLLELINLGVEQFLVKPLELNKIFEVFYTTAKRIYDNNMINLSQNSKLIRITSDYSWDKDTLQLLYKNNYIKLSKKEILLVELLIKNNNKISTIDEILAVLWEDNIDNASTKNLKAILSRFRKKFEDIEIENIYGIGYKLNMIV
jgi:DNA-binding response OmpR family regulator